MDRIMFINEAHQMTLALHEKALASQIHALSSRLGYKYRFVFGAFLCAALAILMLLYATASYLWHVG